MKKKWKQYIAIMTVAALITGCSSTQNNTNSGTQSTVVADSSDSTGTAETVSTTNTTSEVVVDKEFTANDLDVGYEESTAVKVTLNGSSMEVSGDGATVKDGILTISDEGTYVVTGTLSDGQIVVEAEDTDKVQIVLNGVTITCAKSAPIYVKNADKVFITLEEGTENTLTDGAEYVQTDDNTVDGVIFSTADLTINGEGTLNITGNYKHGIASKDDLIITGGTYNITAVKDALNGKDCVKIKDGTFNLTVTDGNGIQSKNGDDTTKGYVYISGGQINILNCQEGIEGTAIVIDDGTIDITAQDDGLNSSSGDSSTSTDTTDDTSTSDTSMNDTSTNPISTDTTTVETTTLNVSNTEANPDTISTATSDNTDTASSTQDDNTAQFDRGDFDKGGGFGKGGGEMENDANCYISINGGTITVDAAGDGIDSNGSVYVTGGTTYVSGPTNDGNASFDYNGSAEISGGTMVLVGSSGMAQGFGDTSTQYSLLYNLTSVSQAGTEVTLTDSKGNVVISYTPEKQYQSVVISTPDLEKDATYTLTSGDQTAEITLSSIVTSNGQQGGAGGFGGRGGQMRPDGAGDRLPPQDATN